MIGRKETVAMATLYDIKPRFQALLRPLTGWLAARGVTANQVTAAAIVLSLALGTALWLLPGSRLVLLLVGPVLFLRMALNAIDGMLAREHDQKSGKGLILNEAGDVISDCAIILPLISALGPYGVSAGPVILFAFTGVLSEFVGVLGPHLGGERLYDGPMGKSDRALFVGLLCFALALFLPGGNWLNLAFFVAAILAALGTRNRAVSALEDNPARERAQS
jgi:CDP-diacylglycerol--glycerol-3-phosphate 3-phosphatidyltransferase